MIMDKLCEFCDATSLNTGGAAGYLIGSVIDLGVARDIGNGQPLFLVITVDTAVDSASDNTTQAFELRSDDSATIDPDTGTLHLSSGAIAQANLTQGRKFVYNVPYQGLAFEQYLGIIQRTAVAAATAGKINAFLTMDGHGWRAYPEGTN